MIILYADDDREDQDVFIEIIAAINPEITVIRAEDGLKTLEILASSEVPDIIFLDSNMPFLNGYQTLIEIRKSDKFIKTRIMIFSTNAWKPADEDYASLDAEHLRKPDTMVEGIATLRAVIGNGPIRI
jgi:CheY-like chemotaxis protein